MGRHFDSGRRTFIKSAGLATAGLAFTHCDTGGSPEKAGLQQDVTRPWIGPEYWSNPLQDWRLADGRIECIRSGVNRNVHILTAQLGQETGEFSMKVRMGYLGAETPAPESGLAGFYFAVNGPLAEYRHNLFYGSGIVAGITMDGRLRLGPSNDLQDTAITGGTSLLGDVILEVTATPEGQQYRVTLSAQDVITGDIAGTIERTIPADAMIGNLALLCTTNPENDRMPAGEPEGTMHFWFKEWKIQGSKVLSKPDQAFGPILFNQYTLARRVMKMTVQFPPIASTDAQEARLEVQDGNRWKAISDAPIDALARTATFRIPDWDDTKDIPYRVVYNYRKKDHHLVGTIRKDPVEKDTIVLAGFGCFTDYLFPNSGLVKQALHQDPDILYFYGDQIYENVAGYGIQREPVDIATLDYLRKYYLTFWSFRDLLKNRPTITLIDDHDVYQGNIWGYGGRKVSLEEHDAGGYIMHRDWVEMVHRTQTSHLPDPYDPTPVEQNLPVYYTAMVYGGISLGIIEDRKWKRGPRGLVPPTGGRPDWVANPQYSLDAYDPPEATLLGERQLQFLREWTTDWRGAEMKALLSQTMFAGTTSLHGGDQMRLLADLDCNGWPRTQRNIALREIRKGFAFHIAGDQHLPTLVQYGIDDWKDASWAFCIPAGATGYKRSWYPETPGKNKQPGLQESSGDFIDGLGNKFTMNAYANPAPTERRTPWERGIDRVAGYGIVRFHKPDHTFIIECWPMETEPGSPDSRQFTGWPRTITQEDNYTRKAAAYLPTLQISGMINPVVQVIDESSNEIVYTLRILGASWRPKVFKNGAYTIKVGDQDSGNMKTLTGIQALDPAVEQMLDVRF